MKALIQSLILLYCFFLSACSVDREVNSGFTCDSEVDCPNDSECYRGFCVAKRACTGDDASCEEDARIGGETDASADASCAADSSGPACGTCSNGCAEDALCCDQTCTPNDENNCNGCGTSCSPGSSCCPDGCKALLSDPQNCGKCGEDCPTQQFCSDGHCCPDGQIWCDSAGRCIDTDSNNDHCGMCNKRCEGIDCACEAGNCAGICTS